MKRSLPVVAAAALSLAVLAVPAGPALAAGHGHGHAAHHHAAAVHGHAAQAQQKVDHQRRGVAHAIAAQARQVTGLLQLAGTSTRVSDTDRTALVAALQADADALAAVQSGLAAATSHSALVAALHQAVLVRSIARQQYVVVAAAGAVRTQAVTLTTSAQDLQTQVDAVSGQDTTAANASLADVAQQVAAMSTGADDAVAAILAVSPAASRDDLGTAVGTAGTDLDTAAAAGAVADQDLLAVQQDLAAWGTPTP